MQIFGMILAIITFFLERWSKNEQLKAEWKKLVETATKKYNEKQSQESIEIKNDYDDLDKDLSQGKFKL